MPDGTGFTGGGTFGYDYQGENNWVFGFEVDFGAMRTDETSSTGPIEYSCCPGTFFDITQRMRTDWLFTARPRIGYAVGNAMPYFTVGVSLTDLDYTGFFTDTFADALEAVRLEEKRAGWTVGGGLEYKVGKRWSLKGEYLYTDFGDDSVTTDTFSTGGVHVPNVPITHLIEMKTHSGRVGISFWF